MTLVAPFTVSDDKLTVSCPATPTSLAPLASITCTASYTIKQSDLDNGSITNHATGHAVFAGNAVDSNPDMQTVTANQSPSLRLDKTATPHFDVVAPNNTADVGDTIEYGFLITNTGNVTLSDVDLKDALVGEGPGGSVWAEHDLGARRHDELYGDVHVAAVGHRRGDGAQHRARLWHAAWRHPQRVR